MTTDVIEGIGHYFVGTAYAKLMTLDAQESVKTHTHKVDHESHLLVGSVIVTTNGMQELYNAPKIIKIRAGHSHGIKALTPVLWACVWPNPENLSGEDFDESVIVRD
jgi:quercetin dioxygenase-like cupin family protein